MTDQQKIYDWSRSPMQGKLTGASAWSLSGRDLYRVVAGLLGTLWLKNGLIIATIGKSFPLPTSLIGGLPKAQLQKRRSLN